MNPRELKINYGKGHYISNTRSKQLTNHNILRWLTNQSRLGFKETGTKKQSTPLPSLFDPLTLVHSKTVVLNPWPAGRMQPVTNPNAAHHAEHN